MPPSRPLFLAGCCLVLLACSVAAKADDVKVHLSQVKAQPEFFDAWYTVPLDAQPTDRIALYPADVANISMVDPIRYVFVPSSLSAANSRATAQLWTNSYGKPLQAVYARGPSHDTARALSAAPLTGRNPDLPAQGRLSVGAAPGEVRVLWTTRAGSAPVVKYGTAPGTHSQQQYGTYTTYTADDMCSQPAAAWGYSSPGFINTAVLKGLAPNTTYYYVFGQENRGWSEEASFTTAPAPGTDAPVRLLVTADMGIDAPDGAELPDDVGVGAQLKTMGALIPPGSSEYTLLKAALLATGQLTPAPGSTATRTLMQHLLNVDKSYHYHGLVMLGGLSMAVGHGAMWDDFLQQMQPVLTRLPLAAAPGDTEAADPSLPYSAFVSAASGGECGVPYSQRLRMPSAAAAELWYSQDVGSVHLVLLNTEQSLAVDSPQYRWLKSDLFAVDRTKTPWVVLGMHRGMYADDPSESGPESPSATLQEQVERLLVEKSVDLVLNGHTRVYHHSCPIIQGHCVGYSTDGTAKGPVHAMLGIGGAAIPLRANAAAPFWVVEESFEHGVAQLVADKTSLTLQVMSSRTGQEVSSFTLTKPAAWQPDPTAAAQRFATLQKATPKQPAVQSALASVSAEASSSSSSGAPDFDGLTQLLQEDLLAAAASSPSVLDKFAGRNSYLSKVVDALADGEAPAPTTTWQTTMQLLQLALNILTTPAGAQQPMEPQDPALPAPQPPILDPPSVVTPPATPAPAQPAPNPWAPNPEPPLAPGPPVSQPPAAAPQLPVVPPPTQAAPLPAAPQEPIPGIPTTGAPQIPAAQQPLQPVAQPLPQQPAAVTPQLPMPVQQPAQQVLQPQQPVQQLPQQPAPQQQVLPEQPVAAGPADPAVPHNFTSSFPKQGHRKPHRSWASPERPVTKQPNGLRNAQRPSAGRGAGHRGEGHGQAGGHNYHYYNKYQHDYYGQAPCQGPDCGGNPPTPCNDPACGCEGEDCYGYDYPDDPAPPCNDPACGCEGEDCYGYDYPDDPPCTDPACGCEGEDCTGRRQQTAQRRRRRRSPAAAAPGAPPANKISAPGSANRAPQRANKPIGDGAKTDPRFHYGQWFQRQQQQQAAVRRGRPLPRPTSRAGAGAPVPPEPAGRSTKRINIPKRAWGDPTVAPMSLQAEEDSWAPGEVEQQQQQQQQEPAHIYEEPMRGGRARVMRISRTDYEASPLSRRQQEHVEGPAAASGAARSLKSVQAGLKADQAAPFSLQEATEAAVSISAKAMAAARAAGRAFAKVTKAPGRAADKRANRWVEAEVQEAHHKRAKLAKWEHDAADKAAASKADAPHHPHHQKHHKSAAAAASVAVASGAQSPVSPSVKAEVKAVPEPMEPVLSKTYLNKRNQQQQKQAEDAGEWFKEAAAAEELAAKGKAGAGLTNGDAGSSSSSSLGSEIEFDARTDLSDDQQSGASSSAELVLGGAQPVAGSKAPAQALQLPEDLTLIRADGSAVPQATVAAFKYVWQLLQGRLLMGDPSTLAMFQPGWAGGWLVQGARSSST